MIAVSDLAQTGKFAPGILPISLWDELSTEERSGFAVRDISAFWTFGDDRVFGGYASALALAVAARSVRLPSIASCHVMFVDATRIGPAKIKVETIRQGRSAAAARAILQQDGVTTVVVQAWLTSSALPGMAPTTLEASPLPDACPAVGFRSDSVGFMSAFEERAIDYPISEEDFVAQAPRVDLWVRPRIGLGSAEPLVSQLFDLLVLDSHMLGPTRRARALHSIDTASLDLAVMWSAVRAGSAWRRVRTESGPADGRIAATTGVMVDEQGGISAHAMQQGRVFHP